MSAMHVLWFAGALAGVAAVPGPAVMATIGRVLTRAEGGALPFAFGLLLGDLVWLWSATLGLGVTASVVGPVLRWVALAGAAYLLVLAWTMWRSEPVAPAAAARVGRRAVLSGFVLQLGNPKALLFYAALVPAVVPIGAVNLAQLLILSAVVAVVLFAINLLYVVGAEQARRHVSSPRTLRAIGRVNAAVLAGTAVLVILSTLGARS
jgi:threonine/homoserine/homoserine lactone efflux protein